MDLLESSTSDDVARSERKAAEGGLAPAVPSAAATKAAEARMAAFASAVASVGGVPSLLGPSDAQGCGPDTHVAALLLACLFGRLTEVGAQSQAAQQLQVPETIHSNTL